MPIQRDGKTYLSLEELSKDLDISIERNAHRVAKKIIEQQKQYQLDESQYYV